MNFQTLKILRLMFDPGVTRTPIRVVGELRKKGKRRLPGDVEKELTGGLPGFKTISFVKKWLDGEMLTRHGGQWVLNSFLPPFPGRAYDRMFENLLSGRSLSPVSAYLAITADCENKCPHCSIKGRKKGQFTAKQWKNVIDQLHGLGTSLISFTGGEPMLFDGLPELVKAAKDGGAETVVFTSGSGFSRKMASELKASGLFATSISLDHWQKEKINAFRGSEKAFDNLVNAVKLSLESGFYTMTGSVLSREIMKNRDYRKIYGFAKEMGVHEFRLIEPMPCGNLFDAPEDAFLTDDEICEIRKFHVETNRKGKLPKVCAFNQIESPEVFGCGAGTQHLFIDHLGEVCPCDFTPLSFGNVFKTPLADIWARMNKVMHNPRRHCFIRKHHGLIKKEKTESMMFPLPPELSEKICAKAGREELPDYFKLVTGAK
ncbi:MAG TPA: hypothetical protein DCZ94_15190 [Lentisphaeria bacterium]|nr:MAG: hypothetical protein A2X48_14115 [Lentisphaerae bacterium GWF2_49_21]HBC88295.1 hypothetical protein [Lentisphaeria bacterium]